MKELNRASLRGLLEALPVEELRDMLQAELGQPESDPDSVRLILSILEERASDEPQGPEPQNDAAWEIYQQRIKTLQKERPKKYGWPLRVASVALIVGLLFAVVPQQAEAETFWEMLQHMSSTVLRFFSGEGKKAEIEYVFTTDNLGLQQVYDSVVELGVTEPVVPMWLPDGYELVECEDRNTPVLKGLRAVFAIGEKEIVYSITTFGGEPAHQYYKDDTFYESYERNGTIFNITRNVDSWIVVWTKENMECSIAIDCQEDTLRRILKSIYVMEEN